MILAATPQDVPRIERAVDTMFDNSPYPTRTESEKEFGRSFLAFLGNIKLFFAAICSAVTFTILLVSANTVAMAVRERTREMDGVVEQLPSAVLPPVVQILRPNRCGHSDAGVAADHRAHDVYEGDFLMAEHCVCDRPPQRGFAVGRTVDADHSARNSSN